MSAEPRATGGGEAAPNGCGDPNADHLAIGLANGYPRCCVNYYCGLVAEGHKPAEEDCRRRGVSLAASWLEDPVGYVRCPACRRAFGQSPNALLNELAAEAAMVGAMDWGGPSRHRPGESWDRLTPEQQECLRGLRSDDIDVRHDAFPLVFGFPKEKP